MHGVFVVDELSANGNICLFGSLLIRLVTCVVDVELLLRDLFMPPTPNPAVRDEEDNSESPIVFSPLVVEIELPVF